MAAERAGDASAGVSVLDGATAEELRVLMAIERLPGYDEVVGRWEAAEHEAALADPATLYYGLREDGELVGFAIVQLDQPNRRAHVKRIAVTELGRGAGGRLLRGMIDHVFTETETDRLDLAVFEDNGRAKRAYENVGFSVEGLMRDRVRWHGETRSMWLMSLLRSEWLAAPGRG